MNHYYLKRKRIVFLFLALLAAGMGYFFYFSQGKNALPPEAVTVEVARVKPGNIPMEAQTVGALFANKHVYITPEFAGQVVSLFCRDGEWVRQGTLLVQLEDAVYKAKAESAKASFIYSEGNYHRMELLRKKGAISQQAVDQALADLKEKKAAAEEAQLMVEKMRLTAPFDGVLGKAMAHLGEYVTAGQKLISLTDIHRLRVEYSLPEKYLRFLKKGQTVQLTTTAYPDRVFWGKVSYVAPTINPEDRTISLYAEVPNAEGELTSGLFVNVMQNVGEEKNVLIVPSTSLVATIDGQSVFKVVEGKAVSVSVKIGQRTPERVQIREGLSVNDVVVVAGQQKIKEGSRVKIKELI